MENKEIEIIEASAEVITEEKNSSFKASFEKFKGLFKSKKLKNQALVKRGGYSIAITALVLAGLIVINWLFGALNDRFNLTIDMTSDKKNSISQENIDFIKALDADVSITVCGVEDSSYMASYAQYYGITISSPSEVEYFDQTITLLQKYNDYNKRITIEYIDPNSTEFSAVMQKYPEYNAESGYFSAGDIIVSSSAGGQERTKYLTLDDIYVIDTDDSMAMYYGTSSMTLAGNRLETSLTSAIDYVTNKQIKKAGIITSHSNNKYSEAYQELLELNNYDITLIDDTFVSDISKELDVIVIASPTKDITQDEYNAISAFLENDGKLNKGLIYFADSSCPSLPTLNTLLKEWGIEVGTGVLFETYEGYHIPDDPTTMVIVPTVDEESNINAVLADVEIPAALAGYVVPMNTCKPANNEITATALMQTSGETVIAPVGSPKTWKDYTDDDKKVFDCVIEAKKTRYDNNIEDISKREMSSFVMAFSSVEYVASVYATDSQYGDKFDNQAIVMACTDRAAHKNSTHTFESKVITADSFYADITEKDSKTIGLIFMGLVPIAVIVAGIVIFVLRRKSV